MKRIFLALFFITVSFYGFSQNHENDSLNKEEHKFLLGITIAPNYSWRQYHYEKNSWTGFSNGAPENDKPSMGYSILLKGQIRKEKFMFNIGAGIGCYKYKGIARFDGLNAWQDLRYEYNHKLICVNTNYNMLIGKKKLWFIGITADISYIYNLTQRVNRETYDRGTHALIDSFEKTFDFTRKQYVFWGGFEVGRTINATKWLVIDFSINCKYSSTIYSNEIKGSSSFITTQPRSLITSSLNITFYPIFQRK
jgi:hypothetical protein